MKIEDEQAVVFTVSTFKDLRENTDDIVRWFETYAETFTCNGRKPQYFGIGYVDGRGKILRHNTKNWEKIKKSMYEGEVEEFFLTFYTTEEELKANQFHPDAMLKTILCTKQINIDEEVGRDIVRANEFTFQMKKDIFNEGIESIVLFFKEVYARLDGIYGYLDYIKSISASAGHTDSPIETVMAISSFLESRFDKYVRGYFWGNILNATHIEALGGEEYVKQNVPYHKFEVLNFDGKKAYYIQMTEHIFTFEPGKALALKEFLKPLLPKEDMYKIAYRDETGELRRLGRLVFNEEDTAKLFDAHNYSEEELREMVYKNTQKKGSFITENKKEYKPVTFTALENADPSALNITIYFEAINENQYKECVDVIQSWETVGIFGGFGESFHYLFGVGKEENGVSFRVDMGSADPVQALTTLERIMNKFSENNDLTIKAMILGDEEL